MTKFPNVLSTNTDNISTIQDIQPENTKTAFSVRLRSAIKELDISDAEVSRRSGISSSSMSSYLNGRSFPNSEQLFPLCDVLGVDPRWLISGKKVQSFTIADASDADWVPVPFYDLREFSETEKGEARSSMPFRKDWLYRTFGKSNDLWMTSLLADYTPLGLHEGEQVICCDITRTELVERQLCLWRVPLLNQTLIGRYSMVHKGNALIVEDEGEYWVNPHLIEGDNEHGLGADIVPIGRILGRVLQRV